jgi:hypothetical protein
MKSPDLHTISDPEYWRERAEEARAMAEQLTHDLLLRRRMLKVADDCEELAKRAAKRLRDRQK